MNDMNYAPVCGTYCGHCNLLGKECSGCAVVDGKPFWTKLMQIDACPIHECCRNRKQLEHCGICAQFPCKAFLELRDPNMGNEEFQQSLKTRQATLEKRKEIGTAQWLQEVSADKRGNYLHAKIAAGKHLERLCPATAGAAQVPR